MYRNTESLCSVPGTNIVLQVNYTSKTNKTNKLIGKKRSDLWLQRQGVGEGELDEGSKKGQTSNLKINKY